MINLRSIGLMLLGYRPRNQTGDRDFLKSPPVPYSGPPTFHQDFPMSEHDHPVRHLHQIRRDVDKIATSLQRKLSRKDFKTMSLDISKLTALGARIDTVAASIAANLSGEPGALASAVSTAVASTQAADQATLDTATTSLTSKVSNLESALASAGSSSVSQISSSLSDVSTSLSPVSTSLSVNGAPLTISTTSLTGASVGTAYTGQIVATGGVSPVTVDIATGSLPDGLTIDTSGNITGTPADDAVTESFTAMATDSSSPPVTVQAPLSITVG